MSRDHKRRRSSDFDGNPPKRHRHTPDRQDVFDEAFNVIEHEHENIELLLYYRRILREMSDDDPLYLHTQGDLELQMAETGTSMNIAFSSTDTDSDTLNKMDFLLDSLIEQSVMDTRMHELHDIPRIEAILRTNKRLKQEVAQFIGEIIARENAEQNYLEWLDSLRYR